MLFVASFNADLEQLSCEAQVTLPQNEAHEGMLELLNDEGDFIEFIPVDASPNMVAIAYRLYGRGLNQGLHAGEEAAWAKLRRLIRAAAEEGA